MRYFGIGILITVAVLLLVAEVALFSCDDSEIDDIDPPSTTPSDETPGNQCNISEEGLELIATAYAECASLSYEEDYLNITGVYGTTDLISPSGRYKIEGAYDFTNTGVVSIEPIIGCPQGSGYQKCSFDDMTSSQKVGEFKLLLNAVDCPTLTENNMIRLNVWFGATSSLFTDFCLIYLDGNPYEDDDDDNNDDSDDDVS